MSGKVDRHRAAAQDTRRAHINFPPVEAEHGWRVVDAIKPVAERHGVSVARMALAWVLAQPAISCAIVGARRLDQLQDNLDALALELTPDDMAELDAASALPPSYPGWIQAATNVHRAQFLA